jgi:hypothetical protein
VSRTSGQHLTGTDSLRGLGFYARRKKVVASYADFLMQKQNQIEPVGFDVGTDNLNPLMMDWQRVIAKWSIRRGRAGIFLDTGLGKTLQQLVVADAVCKTTNGKFLLLTPLAVAHQT